MVYEIEQDIYFLRQRVKKKDKKYFNYLFRAIALVDKKYIYYTVNNVDQKSQEAMCHLERVFAYELYRQWANILSCECHDKYVLNAELDKIVKESIYYHNSKKKEAVIMFPDLVMHGGQGNTTRQKMICEIKRNKTGTDNNNISNQKIFADLYKLTCYLDKTKFHDKFDYGVFILLNGCLSQISNMPNKTSVFRPERLSFGDFKEDFKEFFQSIVCVTYDGVTLQYDLLSELLDKKTI